MRRSGFSAPHGNGPFARDTVTTIAPIIPNSSMVLATVSWADGHISELNMANLERQPGNPAPEAWLPAKAKRISGISCAGLQLRPLAHRAA